MTENTSIEWADHTFNPWIGCTKVGPGCDHCYAEKLAASRLGVPWGPHAERRRTAASSWKLPRRLNSRAARAGIRYRLFCGSLCDVFDNAAPPEWRADLFAEIRETPHLDWLIVTKRIGNAAGMIEAAGGMPDNVWLGATIVNQAEADRDIPKLLATPARVRFLSMEPLLGPVNLEPWLAPDEACEGCDDGEGYGNRCGRDDIPRGEQCPWKRAVQIVTEHGPFSPDGEPSAVTSEVITLDWIIVGGESGPAARPMHPDWARDLRDQCAAAGVPFFFKQWGEWAVALDRERDDPDWRADYTNDYADHGKSRWINLAGGSGFHGERFHVMRRVGKRDAGRLLDGIEHDGFPQPQGSAE